MNSKLVCRHGGATLPKTSEDGFYHYLDLRPEDRDPFLNFLHSENPKLWRDTDQLIKAHQKAELEFLSGPGHQGFSSEGDPSADIFPDLGRVRHFVDRYELISRLGSGGAAEVFRGKISGPCGFEKHVALKRILPHLQEDEEFRVQFEREAKLSSLLCHANIAQTFDLLSVQNQLWLVMEFVSGENLRSLIKRARERKRLLPLSVGVYVISEVCKGLAYAHEKADELGRPLGIIHRDISPGNIMIAEDGVVRIIDFGIAKALSQAQHTNAGVLKGTVSYMSPEQALGLSLDYRTDIFSAAAILWEMISGKSLFTEENTLMTLDKVRGCQIPTSDLHEVDVPIRLKEILDRALQRNPDYRFQSAEQFHQALENFLKEIRSVSPRRDLIRWVSRIRGGGPSVTALSRRTKVSVPALPEPERSTWGNLMAGAKYSLRVALLLALIFMPFETPQLTPLAHRARCSTRVYTEPSSARISVNGTFMGITPVRLTGYCGEPTRVTLDRAGYQRTNKTLLASKNNGVVSWKLISKSSSAASAIRRWKRLTDAR